MKEREQKEEEKIYRGSECHDREREREGREKGGRGKEERVEREGEKE